MVGAAIEMRHEAFHCFYVETGNRNNVRQRSVVCVAYVNVTKITLMTSA